MAGYKYMLKWEKDGQALVLPVRMEKAYSRDYGFKAEMICPKERCIELEAKLKQVYICEECRQTYSLGDLNLRRDKETGIIFDKRAWEQYMKQNVKKEIEIIKEIDIMEAIINMDFIDEGWMLYTGDEYDKYIAKIHKYLMKNGVALLGKVGYRDSVRGVIVIPSHDKLMCLMLRDGRLIKDGKAEVEVIPSHIREELRQITEYKKGEYLQFLEMVANGEEIKIQETRKEEAVIEAGGLEAV